jgi:hypothetical protein
MPVWTEGRKLRRSRSEPGGSRIQFDDHGAPAICNGYCWPVLTTLASSRYLDDDMSRTDRFCADRSESPSAKRAADDLLSLLNDGVEMLGAFQALGESL